MSVGIAAFAAGCGGANKRDPVSAPPTPVATRLPEDFEYLGHQTLLEAKLVSSQGNLELALPREVDGRDALLGKLHLYAAGDFYFALHDREPVYLDMMRQTHTALLRMRTEAPKAYALFMEARKATTAPTLRETPWRNRFKAVVISFDRTPVQIAASFTVLGDTVSGVTENCAIISIDRETALGTDPHAGSRVLYGAAQAAENYDRYFKDGVLYTLVHEMAHRYIDQHNSTSELANFLYNARTDGGFEFALPLAPELLAEYVSANDVDHPDRKVRSKKLSEGLRDNEEVIANETATRLVGPILSRTMNDVIQNDTQAWRRNAEQMGLPKRNAALDLGDAAELVVE